MISVSEIQTTAPENLKTPLQAKTYELLEKLKLSFQRVDTDEVITMEDCTAINQKLDMKMVKTLFLCDRKQTSFYLFITKGDKPFKSKDFSAALVISRISFAPADQMKKILGTEIGAATIFSILLETAQNVKVVIDKEVIEEEWYGCSDGTTTGYIKIKTEHIVNAVLPYTHHQPAIIEI